MLRAWASALTLIVVTSVTVSVSAQQQRAILWLVEVAPDATIDRDTVAQLFSDLLMSATDARHIVEVEGLARHIRENGLPIPSCLAGIEPCPNVIRAVANELRLDIIATVRVHDQGQRMTLTVSSVDAAQSRVLQFEESSLREAVFRVVTDFVGASGTLTVSSQPTGAVVFVENEQVGMTPYQAEIPVGIYRVIVQLDGYQTSEQTIEVRPEDSRVLDLELQRLYAQLLVQTATPEALLTIDGQAVADLERPVRLQPGSHTIRLEAVDHMADERVIELEPASDRTLRIDLAESPEARRRRLMGYVYERPFYIRGSFRAAWWDSGFADASGELGGTPQVVVCPSTDDGGCRQTGIPLGSFGLEAELGYSFKYLEVSLLALSLGRAPVSSSTDGGNTLWLTSAEGSHQGGQESSGRLGGVTHFELRPLAVGARLLITEVWAMYLHLGFGWYKDFFDLEAASGTSGSFDRSGLLWTLDTGVRMYLNDALYLQGSLTIGDDLSHSDSGMSAGFQVGVGFSLEDFIGVGRLFDRDGSSSSTAGNRSTEAAITGEVL